MSQGHSEGSSSVGAVVLHRYDVLSNDSLRVDLVLSTAHHLYQFIVGRNRPAVAWKTSACAIKRRMQVDYLLRTRVPGLALFHRQLVQPLCQLSLVSIHYEHHSSRVGERSGGT